MNKATVRARIEETGIIPAMRFSSAEDTVFAVNAVADSGIPIAEVTMTTPGAVDVIAELARTKPELIVGAGTVLDLDTARRCLDAGAKFLSSPGFDLQIVEFAQKEAVAMLPGVVTPSEIIAAWKAGSDLIKVFPCSLFGGPHLMSALKSPFPKISLIAAGGVTLGNAAGFIEAVRTAAR